MKINYYLILLFSLVLIDLSTELRKVTLFADAEVVSFYKRQGWELEPKGSKCAFWYAN